MKTTHIDSVSDVANSETLPSTSPIFSPAFSAIVAGFLGL